MSIVVMTMTTSPIGKEEEMEYVLRVLLPRLSPQSQRRGDPLLAVHSCNQHIHTKSLLCTTPGAGGTAQAIPSRLWGVGSSCTPSPPTSPSFALSVSVGGPQQQKRRRNPATHQSTLLTQILPTQHGVWPASLRRLRRARGLRLVL